MVTIQDTIYASATLIEQYKSQGYTDYQSALKLANARVTEKILATNGEYTKKKLNEIKKLIEIEITKAYGGLFESIADESVEIAKVTFNAVAGVAGLTATLPKETIKELVTSTRPIQMSFTTESPFTKEVDNINQLKPKKNEIVTAYTFKKLFEGTRDTNINVLQSIIAGAEAQGKTAQEMARDYAFKSDSLSKGQITSNIRTILFDSRNQAVYNSYEEIEKTGINVYYEHDSVLDGNTSPICRSLDKRKYFVPLEEIPQAFRPPIHGNCRSQLSQKVKDFKGNKNLKASAFGQIEDISYPNWFKKQEASFQRSVLGKKKYEAYKKGGYKINSFPDIVGSNKKSLNSYTSVLVEYMDK